VAPREEEFKSERVQESKKEFTTEDTEGTAEKRERV
jgi:hypothetical protein